jgi:transcriptional regulator with XRE-family HTH domain
MRPQVLNRNGRQLPDQLRMLRERAGFTQQQAAHELGLSRHQVCRMKNRQLPGYIYLLAMLDAYQPTSARPP